MVWLLGLYLWQLSAKPSGCKLQYTFEPITQVVSQEKMVSPPAAAKGKPAPIVPPKFQYRFVIQGSPGCDFTKTSPPAPRALPGAHIRVISPTSAIAEVVK